MKNEPQPSSSPDSDLLQFRLDLMALDLKAAQQELVVARSYADATRDLLQVIQSLLSHCPERVQLEIVAKIKTIQDKAESAYDLSEP